VRGFLRGCAGREGGNSDKMGIIYVFRINWCSVRCGSTDFSLF
jgi:hypothetical protein